MNSTDSVLLNVISGIGGAGLGLVLLTILMTAVYVLATYVIKLLKLEDGKPITKAEMIEALKETLADPTVRKLGEVVKEELKINTSQ